MTTKLSSLEGAKAIVVDDSGFREILCAWFGGTQFTVYAPAAGSEFPLDERTTFTVTGDDGTGPETAEEAEQHAREWLETTLQEEQP